MKFTNLIRFFFNFIVTLTNEIRQIEENLVNSSPDLLSRGVAGTKSGREEFKSISGHLANADSLRHYFYVLSTIWAFYAP